MATEVKLPRLGQGMEAGTIVRWLKAEGDEVAKGEPLFELDTDKVTQEVEADAAGVLLKIVVPEGEANVGATVAVIGSADEDVSELLTGAQGGNGDAPATPTDPPTVARNLRRKRDRLRSPTNRRQVAQGDKVLRPRPPRSLHRLLLASSPVRQLTSWPARSAPSCTALTRVRASVIWLALLRVVFNARPAPRPLMATALKSPARISLAESVS